MTNRPHEPATLPTALHLPPGPPPLTNFVALLRFFRELQRDMIGYTASAFAEYGDIVRVTIADETQVMIMHPDHIQEVAVRQADKFHKDSGYTDRKKGLARFLGSGLLTSDGEFWKRQRRLAAPALHVKRIESYAQTMVDCTLRMLDGWAGKSAIDVDEEMMRATLQIVARTLFSVDISAEAGRIGGAMTVLQEFAGSNNAVESLLPAWLPTPRRFREAQAVRDLDEIVYRLIAERRASGEDNGDLLSMLLLARDDDGAGMTDEQVRDEAVTMFLAGHETTANTLNWTWLLLAQHPEVEARLHAELDRVLAGRAPSLADLKDLPYTEMILKESMRLYPPAYGFGRVAIEDVTVGGYDLPKGTTVQIFSYQTHRDPRWRDAPLEFRPERFSPENEAQIPRYAYLPFGAGPRICIGNRFAMMEAHLMLATIAQRYQLRLSPGQTVQPDPLLTLRPKGGLRLRVEPRVLAEHSGAEPQTSLDMKAAG